MPLTEPLSYLYHREFVDFDELAEGIQQWDLDLLQLDRGAFSGELLQFGMNDVHIGEARFGRALVQKGTPPPGLRTIGVPANRDVRFSWRGHQVSGNDLLIFPRGAELSAASSQCFHVYTCSFPEDLLASISDATGVDELDDLREDATAMCCSDIAMDSVRKCLRRLCTAVRGGEQLLAHQGIHDDATRELPLRLLSAIATSHASCSPETTRKRELALLRAENYVEQHAREDINVRDICREAQVSQRTLEYAFLDRFGVTPKAFLIARRLNGIRRQLNQADPVTDSVADIANGWGIWHMGQFAADYRKHFGELPSETLRRADN